MAQTLQNSLFHMVKMCIFAVLVFLNLPAAAQVADPSTGIYNGTEDPGGRSCQVTIVSASHITDPHATSPNFGDDFLVPYKRTVSFKTSFTGDQTFTIDSSEPNDDGMPTGLYSSFALDGRSGLQPKDDSSDIHLALDTATSAPTKVTVPVARFKGYLISSKVCIELTPAGAPNPQHQKASVTIPPFQAPQQSDGRTS